MLLAAALVFTQGRYASSFFEFGTIREFEGRIETGPPPAPLVKKPGEHQVWSRYLLVKFGKYGAADEVAHDGRLVRLKGTLIYRDEGTMVQVERGTMEAIAEDAAAAAPNIDHGEVTLDSSGTGTEPSSMTSYGTE